jgi:hypothetical protein
MASLVIICRNLASIGDFGAPLTVYTSEDGRGGVEFQTDVGPIDILATGWVGRHLSGEHKVFGVVLAADTSEKLRYAATQVPQVRLMEYELRFSVKPADL